MTTLYDLLNKEMNNLNDNNIIKNNEIKNLYLLPPKEKGLDKIHFQYISPNWIHQADTLILPNDGGYDKLLVVTDQGNRLFDAEPLIDASSETAFDALKKIYSRKIIKKPHIIMTDDGNEFKGAFITGCNSMNIKVEKALVGRSRQVGIVERKNLIIGKLIHKYITERQIATKQSSSQWLHLIKNIVSLSNNRTKKNFANKPPNNDKDLTKDNMFPVTEGKSYDFLKVGQKVRVQLDKPIDSEKNKLYGGFRSSDIRWAPEIRKIENIFLGPGQPVLYYLDGDQRVMYTRQQLQKVTNFELKIPDRVVENPVEERFTVKKLISREKRGNVIYFQVKWKVKRGVPNSTTWEKRSELIKDIPQLIKAFESKNK